MSHYRRVSVPGLQELRHQERQTLRPSNQERSFASGQTAREGAPRGRSAGQDFHGSQQGDTESRSFWRFHHSP